jgi:serine/threonine protein kinase
VRAGIGSFGSVYKADYRGQEVAAKILNSQMNAKQIDEFKRFVQPRLVHILARSLSSPLIDREVNILNRLRCPYVLNFVGASHVEGKRCIITELCSQGSLADLVFSEKPFTYLLLLKVALDMSKAVAFLHGYAGKQPRILPPLMKRLT